MKMDKQITKIYEDPGDPGSLGGIRRLVSSAKNKGLNLTKEKVEEILKGNETYTMHKPIRRRIVRNQIIVKGIDSQWQADLADMNDIVKFNDGFRYMLTVIDCFSKFAWVVPVKTKDGPSVRKAFDQVFEMAKPRKPSKIQTDKGKEFLNKDVQDLFSKFGIKHFVTENETKAAMVERFNRTLKTRIWAYFTAANTRKYIEVLPKIVHSYNHSHHRTIGVRPVDVKKTNELKIWKKMYGKTVGMIRSKGSNIKDGSDVRIAKHKHIFEKGYLPNWTGELFKVAGTKPTKRKRVYKLKDYAGEEIKGTFYPEEILQVTSDPNRVWPIEKVVKTRKTKLGTEHLVKWLHWPEKFNSWVKDRELARIDDQR